MVFAVVAVMVVFYFVSISHRACPAHVEMVVHATLFTTRRIINAFVHSAILLGRTVKTVSN